MKIAIFFRGALRPNPATCHPHITNIVDDFRNAGHDVTTWLITWKSFNNFNTSDYSTNNYFDNVLMLTPPSDSLILQYTNKLMWRNVWYTYYQSKIATQLIKESDNFDFIVNTRPDLLCSLGNYLTEWLDPEVYCSPHTTAPWINDFMGIATPELMLKSWDYGSFEQLGYLMNTREIPEHILMELHTQSNVVNKMCTFEVCYLDPSRFS